MGQILPDKLLGTGLQLDQDAEVAGCVCAGGVGSEQQRQQDLTGFPFGT